MGTVYEAEQLEPLRRTVALKVIRLGMDTDEVLARFESERQALAVMDHPNIARALDAGTTDEGLPYFVMELVAGEPITDYCDRHGLDIRRRLQLFLGVCRGVQHAHQKGVIHRDLKPSNILVRVTDGQPVATIIDFGIAKATERRLTDSEFTTQLGVAVGTPAYMSPEQAQASELDVDTRTDIYSLGMVLYELMTGVLPFDRQGLLPAAFIAEYVLGNADVPTPSRRVATLESDTATDSARRRHTTPVGLRRELRGDIDWIVVKAIERDRTRRYETVNGLALDLERYLEHKPVTARPPTLGYTTARFVRRHRLGVSVLATAAVALVVGVTGIMRERERAARGEAKALAISTFLVDLFKSADPWQGGARQTTVVDALAEGVKQVNAGRVADPVIASTLRRTIATVYAGLGRNAEADTLYRETLRERLARTGPASEEAAESWNDLGTMLTSQGKFDSAETALGRALEIRRRHGARTPSWPPTCSTSPTWPPSRASSPARTRSPRRRSRSTGGRSASAISPWRWPWAESFPSRARGASWRRPSPPAARRSRCSASSGRSGTRSRYRSSVTWRSFSRTRGSTPRRSPSGGRRCRSTLRCSAPRTPPSPPISRISATSTTRPASPTARSSW